MNKLDRKDDQVTLELLGAIEERSDVSQRHLSAKLGIALGLTNSYLKRCARKGYVKIQEVPANRYLYYLTPKGLAEKSRLTAQFLSTSLTFYRQAAEACNDVFWVCQSRGWRRIVLCGVSDLAEIASTRTVGHPITVVGLYDPGYHRGELLSLPVWRDWRQVPEVDGFVVTDLADPLTMYRRVNENAPERVLAPAVLGLDGAIKKST
ncbi:MAG: winged helix-turn-helix transcriptional regulator [Gammaproteobacteria bacterium]|nr:winged helix-turn-helix transcriptional regulator [Gammaproteobacteria bacterium]